MTVDFQEQRMSDYLKYRGRCKELAEAEIAKDPSLRLVRGYYHCPVWRKKLQHWWAETPKGDVVDPSALQFPSAGAGEYEEFDGMVECAECGKKILEETAYFEGRYAFCGYNCFGKFVGLEEYVHG